MFILIKRSTLSKLQKTIEKIDMTQDELVQQLKDDSAKIIKIGTETRSLLTKVQELLDQIAAGTVKQEVTDAAADVQTQLGIVDDLVPDAPPVP
jgi:uncharacterized protein (DUF2344 family)